MDAQFSEIQRNMENIQLIDSPTKREKQSDKKSQGSYSSQDFDNSHPIQSMLSAELRVENKGRNVKKTLFSADIVSNMLGTSSFANNQTSQSEQKRVVCNRQLFLCAPDFLELKYVINPWMNLSARFSVDKAKSQWEELVAVYMKIAPEAVHVVPAKEKLTELCFFGDSVFAYKNKAVFGRFATDERFPETQYVMEYIRSCGIEGVRVPEGMHYEGSGETMLWNGKILVGYGRRNSQEIVPYLKEQFQTLDVIGFELVDPEFYHLDTAMFPISNDLIAVYADAFSPEAQKAIANLGCEILYLSYKDAKEFALNSTVIGKHAIVHYEAENFISILQQRGFIVHTVDVSEFIKFGGGLKCLTFQHYLS